MKIISAEAKISDCMTATYYFVVSDFHFPSVDDVREWVMETNNEVIYSLKLCTIDSLEECCRIIKRESYRIMPAKKS